MAAKNIVVAIKSPTPTYRGIAGGSEGGTGYVQTYTGASGVVPVAADPAAGESLTGKTSLHVWAEITHVTD